MVGRERTWAGDPGGAFGVTAPWLHFVWDTAFREDASKIRTGHGPTNIAAGLRATVLRPYERPPALLGLN